MIIQAYVLGSGRSAQALEKSLRILEILHPDFHFEGLIHLKRGESLPELKNSKNFSLLLIANPHGLHAEAILEADQKGFNLIITEKPAAVNLEQIALLRKVKTSVAVCHVYRQTWGAQTLKEMLKRGDFGELITVEGRYWQSSAAQRALKPSSAIAWKNDVRLNGAFDAYLDIGTHWADMAVFLIGEQSRKTSVWFSYKNSEAPHRDSHFHLTMNFPSGARALASASKTVHGATNHFEINLIGTKKSATWKFLEADQIEIGEGANRSFLSRSDSQRGSQQSPFHGTGWLEGYIEIIYQALKAANGEAFEPYPTLSENLDLLNNLLQANQEHA